MKELNKVKNDPKKKVAAAGEGVTGQTDSKAGPVFPRDQAMRSVTWASSLTGLT